MDECFDNSSLLVDLNNFAAWPTSWRPPAAASLKLSRQKDAKVGESQPILTLLSTNNNTSTIFSVITFGKATCSGLSKCGYSSGGRQLVGQAAKLLKSTSRLLLSKHSSIVIGIITQP